MPPPGAVIAPQVQAYLHGIGLFDPQPAFENVGLAFGRKVVLSSDTIWFISAGVVHDELESGLLSGIRLNDDLLGGPVGVAMRNNAVMTDEQRHLLAALVEAAGHR